MQRKRNGVVLIVGAGPGAADLLTLRALRAIESADVALVDALVSAEIHALIPARVRVINVGKRAHRRSTPQDFINRLMARYACSGARVVRLKGGDPSLFGRTAEERAFLERLGVSVEVIPGVTTASAAAAQFGFALSERGKARRVLFATGRTMSGPEGDWAAAADAKTTLCLYMGCAHIADIVARLIMAGRAPHTPALVAIGVERPEAHAIATTMAQLARDVAHLDGETPVFIAIGEACRGARRGAGEAYG